MPFNKSYNTKTRKIHSSPEWSSPKTNRCIRRIILILLFLFTIASLVALLVLLVDEEEEEEVLYVNEQLGRKASGNWDVLVEEESPTLPPVNSTTDNTTDIQEGPVVTTSSYSSTTELPDEKAPLDLGNQTQGVEISTTDEGFEDHTEYRTPGNTEETTFSIAEDTASSIMGETTSSIEEETTSTIAGDTTSSIMEDTSSTTAEDMESSIMEDTSSTTAEDMESSIMEVTTSTTAEETTSGTTETTTTFITELTTAPEEGGTTTQEGLPTTTTYFMTTTDGYGNETTTASSSDDRYSGRDLPSTVTTADTTLTVIETETTDAEETTTIVTDVPDKESDIIVCNTAECYELAEEVETRREETVDPCVDFYSYACNGAEEQEGELNKRKRFTSKILSDAIKANIPKFEPVTRYYEKCVEYYNTTNETQRTDEVREVLLGLESYNGKTDSDDENVEVNNLIEKLILMDGFPFFDVSIDVSNSNSSRFDIVLMPHHKNHREVLSPHYIDCQQDLSTNLTETYNKTMTCMETATWTAGKTVLDIHGKMYGKPSKNQKQEIDTGFFIVEEMLEKIEKELPSLAKRKEDLLGKKYIEKTVEQLMDDSPYCSLRTMIEWKHMFELLFGRENIHDDTIVQIYMDQYFDKISEYLCGRSPIDFMMAIRLTAAIKLYFEFVLEPENEEEFCIEKTKYALQDVLSSLYLHVNQENSGDEQLEKIQGMFNHLKEELVYEARSHLKVNDDIVQKLEEAEIVLTKESNQMKFEEDSLNTINWDTSYPQLSVDLRGRLKKKLYNLYKKPTGSPESLWFLYQVPYSTYGSSSYLLNLIWYSSGLMGNTSLTDLPDAVAWAWDGQVLAHELMHLLDHEGLRDLVPRDDLDTDCFLEKLRKPMEFSHENKTWSFKPPAELMLSEMFSDVGALDFGYKSLASSNGSNVTLPDLQLTPTQLYFVTMAQWHCSPPEPSNLGSTIGHSEHLPPPVRVNEMVKNSKVFKDAFNCKTKVEASTRQSTTTRRVRGKGRGRGKGRRPQATTKKLIRIERECKAFPYYIHQMR